PTVAGRRRRPPLRQAPADRVSRALRTKSACDRRTALPWPPPPGRYRPERPRRTLSIPWSYGRFFLSGSSRHFLTRRQKRIVLLGGPDRDPQMPRAADIPD